MESYHLLSALDPEASTRFNLTPQHPDPNTSPWPHIPLPARDTAYSHEALKHARRNTFPPMQLGTAAADVGTIRFHPTRAIGSPKSLQQEGTKSTPRSKYQSVQCVLCQVALHSNENIRDHLSTQQHSEAILQHPEARLQDILIPESFVSEALRKGADPTSEPSVSAAQTSSSPRKRELVWSSENQQEEVNQIHQTSFKISDSEFELAKRMKLDVTPTQSVSHTKPLEVPNHQFSGKRPSQPTPTHQQMNDIGPRYGLGRSDGNVHQRYGSGKSENSIPRYGSGRSESNVSGYNTGKPNSTAFERYDSKRPESNVPGYESRGFKSNLPRYAPERSESNISSYKKFESNTPTYEFGRSETSFPRYNSGSSKPSSKPSLEARHVSESEVPSHGVGRPGASGPKHTPSKPEASALQVSQESFVKETVLHCKVCDIAVPNQFHWEFHVKTKKHLQSMRVFEEAKELEKGEREREKREREEEWRKRVRAEEKEREKDRMEEEWRLKMLEEEKRREIEKRNMEGRAKVETQRQSWRRAGVVTDTAPSVADKVMVDKWSAKVEDSAPEVTSTNQQEDSPGPLSYFTADGICCRKCNFAIRNRNYWKAHVSSQRHRNRLASGLRTKLSPTQAMVDLHESPFHCILCDVSTTDESTFAQHMEGKRHRNNLGLRQSLNETLKASQPQSSIVVSSSSSAAVHPMRSVLKLSELPDGPPAISSYRQQSIPPTHTTTTAQPQTHKPFVSWQNTSVQQNASTNTQVKEKQISEQGTKKGKIIRLKRPWRKNRSDDSSSVVSNDSTVSGEPTVTAARPAKEHHTLQQATSQERFKVRSPTSGTQLVRGTLNLDQRERSSSTIATQQQPASTNTVQHQTKPLAKALVHSSTMQQGQSSGPTMQLQEGAKRAAIKCKLRQKALRYAGRVESSQRPEPISTTVAKVTPTTVSRSSTAMEPSQRWQQRSPQLQLHSPQLPMSHRNKFRVQSNLGQPEMNKWEYEADKAYPGRESYEMEVGNYEGVGVESYEERGVESYEERGVESYEERGVESYEEEGVKSYGIGGVESYEIGKSDEHYRPEDFEGDALEFEIHPDTPDFDQYQDNTLSFDLHAKLNPNRSSQFSSSESHTRVFGSESRFRKDPPQHGFSSTQAPALPGPHNGSKDWHFANTDSSYSGTSSADLKQSHFANSTWSSRPPPFTSPRPTVNSPSRLGSLDGGSNPSHTRSAHPAANTSPADWLLTDTAGRLRSVETINYHHGWNQKPNTAQQQTQSGLEAQTRPGFGAQTQQHPLGTAVYQQSKNHSGSAVWLNDGQFEGHQPPAAMPQSLPGQRSSDSSRTHTWQQEQKPPHVDRFHSTERSAGERWVFEHHKFPTTLSSQNIPSQPRKEFPYFSRVGFNTARYQTF